MEVHYRKGGEKAAKKNDDDNALCEKTYIKLKGFSIEKDIL